MSQNYPPPAGPRLRFSATGAGSLLRTFALLNALAGVIFGLILIFLPAATLLWIAIMVGLVLIFSGIFRTVTALRSPYLPANMRFLLAFLGALVASGGIVCLLQPSFTLMIVAILLGVSWLLSGVGDIAAALGNAPGRSRLPLLATGALAAIAGIIVIVVPLFSLEVFTQVAGVFLIIISVVALLNLPGRPENANLGHSDGQHGHHPDIVEGRTAS